jgi:hypothetical protein
MSEGKTEGVWIKDSADRVGGNETWALFVQHVQGKEGKGFIPLLRKKNGSAEFRAGDFIWGTDTAAYEEALNQGEEMLTRHT